MELQYQLKWGFAGLSKLCDDIMLNINNFDQMGHKVVAVADRNTLRAHCFAEVNNISEVFENYVFLATHEHIDIIYVNVGLIERFQVAKMMLLNGKHVLVEKPMALNTEQTNELIYIARENGRFLMESVWSFFFPIYNEIRQQMFNNIIGEIGQLVAYIGIPIVSNLRASSMFSSAEHNFGAIMDMSTYLFTLARFVFPTLVPLDINVTGHINLRGVDDNAVITFRYPGKQIAVFSLSNMVLMSNTAEIMGTRGHIRIPSFWCPTEICSPMGIRQFPLQCTGNPQHVFNMSGLIFLLTEVKQCIYNGLQESPYMTWADSSIIAHWRDFVRLRLGVLSLEERNLFNVP